MIWHTYIRIKPVYDIHEHKTNILAHKTNRLHIKTITIHSCILPTKNNGK